MCLFMFTLERARAAKFGSLIVGYDKLYPKYKLFLSLKTGQALLD